MSIRLTAGYTALMAVLGVTVFAVPQLAAFGWAGVGVASVGAVLLGTRLHSPTRPSAWWMLAAAIAAMAIGDTIYGASVHHRETAAAAIADLCYLAMFPLLILGLIQMVRSSAGPVDWSRLLDLLIFTCAAALLGWVFLVGPSLDAVRLGPTDKSALAAYTLGDLLTLVTTVRLVLAARRGFAVILLTAGAAAVLVADFSYALAELGGGWRPGGPAEAAYLLFYVAWGAAALQPSMVWLTVPAPTRYSQLPMRWAALLGLSLAIPPVVLGVEALTGPVRDAVVIAVTSTLMSALVITRLGLALRRHSQATARERGLRQACGALVSAADVEEVSLAVRGAVRDLVPPGTDLRVVLAVYEISSTGSSDPVAAIIRQYPLPSPTQRRTRLLNTRTLHPELRDQLEGFPAALACPLIVDQREGNDPGLGALLVAAEHGLLATVQDCVEVLAAQATLALERIALTDAINRRDSERYLRTVTRNSVDVVLIVDDDQRILYASPALAGILGEDPPLFATLRDVVQVGDREQVAGTLAASQRSTQPEGARDWWHLPRPDGSVMTVEVNCRDLRQDRMVRGYLITLRDISEDGTRQRESIARALNASPAGQNRESSHRRFR